MGIPPEPSLVIDPDKTEKKPTQGWIGVDFDGTLAEYHGWSGPIEFGPPIPAMVERVQRWLSEGRDVRIFTARMFPGTFERNYPGVMGAAITNWCVEHIGQALPITYQKDYEMDELWDDRAVQVEENTGRRIGYSRRGLD